MAYSPLVHGGVTIEVSKNEYEELVRASEKIAAAKRFLAANEYVSTKDLAALLDIDRETKEGV